MPNKILVVDDEVAICDLLKINLESEGYIVETALGGRDGIRKVESFEPDLLILDVMLPGMSGLDICKKIISEKPLPVILLTAKSDLVDKVLGLELGADDYITKPFHTRELLARVKALLRRSTAKETINDNKKYTNGGLEIIDSERKVLLDGKEIDLSTKEYEVLIFLMKRIEQVFTRENLLEKVWGYDFIGDTRTVDVHIQRLRKKLKEDSTTSNYIQTVFGVGYKMKRMSES
jgi:DNA-binding response OmpR family regulator